MADPLAEYRGLGMPRTPPAEEAAPDARRAEELHARMLVGTAASRLQATVGTTEDAGRVIGAVIARVEREVQEGMAALLGQTDLGNEAAREMHFNARVAAATLTYLNQMIRDGQRAAAELYESEQ